MRIFVGFTFILLLLILNYLATIFFLPYEVLTVHREELKEHFILFGYFLRVDIHYERLIGLLRLCHNFDFSLFLPILCSFEILDKVMGVCCFVSGVEHVWSNLTGSMSIGLIAQVDHDR